MKLGELVAPGEHVGADLLRREISSLAYDSRRVKPGALFFAIRGEKADGYNFVKHALERGAVAVASERPAPPDFQGCWVQVNHAHRALAEAAQVFYGAESTTATLSAAGNFAQAVRPFLSVGMTAYANTLSNAAVAGLQLGSGQPVGDLYQHGLRQRES